MQDNKKTSKTMKIVDGCMLSNREIALIQLNEIISKLPPHITGLINEGFEHKRAPKEYLLSSVFFAYSSAAGLAYKIKTMTYTNYANLYFVLFGSRGDTKSIAMELACGPLKTIDDLEDDKFNQAKSESQNNFPVLPETDKIARRKLLVQNITIEAAMHVHSQNPYSIGIYVDELKYIFDKISNQSSNEGSVLRTFLLQGYTNSHVDVIRKTTDTYRMKKSCPSILGSIQNQFTHEVFANGNLESGFIDRLLFTTQLTDNPTVSEKDEFDHNILSDHEGCLINLLESRNEIEAKGSETLIKFDQDSIKRIREYSQSTLSKKYKETSPIFEYRAKMMISIHKLVLLCHLIKNSRFKTFENEISIDTVELAILINEYYLTHFRIILENANQKIDEKLFKEEVIKRAVKSNIPQKDIRALLGYSKGYVSKLYNKEISNGN